MAVRIINGYDPMAGMEEFLHFTSNNAKAFWEYLTHSKENLEFQAYHYFAFRRPYTSFNTLKHQVFPTDEPHNAFILAAMHGNAAVMEALISAVDASRINYNFHDFKPKYRYERPAAKFIGTANALCIAMFNVQACPGRKEVAIKLLSSTLPRWNSSKELVLEEYYLQQFCKNWIGQTHYYVLSPLQAAVLPGYDLEFIELLITKYKASPNQYSHSSDSDYNRQFSVLDLDAEHQMKVKDVYEHATTLFFAIAYNDDTAAPLISLLLKLGADVNVITKVNGVSYTPYSLAQKQGKKYIASLLEENSADTELHLANAAETKRASSPVMFRELFFTKPAEIILDAEVVEDGKLELGLELEPADNRDNKANVANKLSKI